MGKQDPKNWSHQIILALDLTAFKFNGSNPTLSEGSVNVKLGGLMLDYGMKRLLNGLHRLNVAHVGPTVLHCTCL